MRSLRFYLIIMGCLMLIYLVAQYNRPKPLNWKETLDINDKIPFGTYLLYNRIHDIFPGAKVQTYREPVYNVLNDHGIKHGTYIIICKAINLNEYDYNLLRKYISNGNDVFIAATYFGTELNKRFKIETQADFVDTQSIGSRFLNTHQDTNKLYYTPKDVNSVYFRSIDTARAIVLGGNTNHHVNFIKYAIGKGNLYLNADPLMFANYSIMDSHAIEYVSTALSFVKKDGSLIWDQYYTKGRTDDETSMRVFLHYPALRWAFYLSFFGMAAFVLYDIKRRQRIIPVIEPYANATVDFVTVVGQVYYENRDNTDIARKKIQYLSEYLRDTFNFKVNITDGEFAEMLIKRTGVKQTLADELVSMINYINAGGKITDRELIKLNLLIEQFYIQSR